MLAAALMLALPALAIDGFLISAHYELPAGQLGNIHDGGNLGGALVRYEIKNDQLAGTKVLYDKEPVGTIVLSPFGDRVVFTKGVSGTIAIISADGGQETDLVTFADGTPRKNDNLAITLVQWPASEGGKWIYYYDTRPGKETELRRVHVDTKKDEFVVRFNRGGWGVMTPDASPNTGKTVVRTDNYAVVVYDFAKGDGDMFGLPTWNPGCGIGVSPDGSMFVANGGAHYTVAMVDMNAQLQSGFRLSEWDGDPTNGINDRDKIEWAWQSFCWAKNSMDWIAVHQGKLQKGTTHATYFQDAMLYNWVEKRQINLTKNPNGKFERIGGLWLYGASENSLGFFTGEAPYTVDIADARLAADCAWNFGDGATAKGATAKHTFTKAGKYSVTGKQGDTTFTASVTVLPQKAPAAKIVYVNDKCLMVDLDEPVTGTPVVTLKSKATVKSAALNGTGRRVLVLLDTPISKDDEISISGLTDRAQTPNPVLVKAVKIVAPAWPSNRTGLSFLWEDQKALNTVYVEAQKDVRVLKITPGEGNVGYDRYGRLRMDQGRMDTGFFAQANKQADFGDLVTANAFSLEVTFQPANLTQSRKDYPVRLINCSAWYPNDWDFMLGQQKDKLLFSIRTTENWLSLDGQPTKGGLGGRAPIDEIATLTDTKAHHLLITYAPGMLTVYMDGKKTFAKEIKGDLSCWGFGELCFGECHNHHGWNFGWQGNMEGVAIYKRALDAAEVQANYAAYQKKLAARVVMPAIQVEATLTAVSEIPDPKKIAPYSEALVVNEYTITKVGEAAKGWKIKLAPGQTIGVAQWGVIDSRKTGLVNAKIGETRTLSLEVYDKHPDKLDQVVTSNDLLDPDLTILYEPKP